MYKGVFHVAGEADCVHKSICCIIINVRLFFLSNKIDPCTHLKFALSLGLNELAV